jgi:hypothetical protein
MTTQIASVVVPAIPPRPPQVSLIASAVKPTDETDPSHSFPDGTQLAMLPDDLVRELQAREGEEWVRGFAYQPEQHGAAWLRDRCDGTSWDFEALPAPSGLTLNRIAGGTIGNETVSYQITAVNAAGETTPCTVVTLATGAGSSSVVLTWQSTADDAQYKVYGRVGGSIGLLATVEPFDPENPPTWTDTGAVSPGAVPPSSNTTGGPGLYTNLPIRVVVPYLIEVMDTCSSWGWSEHDFKGRALRWLDNATPQALEAEFWTGNLAQAKGYPNDYLTNSSTVTDLTPGTVPSVTRGLQILQDALQQTGFGGQGMIHTQAQTAPNLLGARRVGALLLDVFDNIIVPGVGYPGTAPGGSTPAAGYAYMYATDLVMVRTEDEGTVFPDTFSEALDRGQAGEPNTITFRAQRFGCAYWDGAAHYACKVQLAT